MSACSSCLKNSGIQCVEVPPTKLFMTYISEYLSFSKAIKLVKGEIPTKPIIVVDYVKLILQLIRSWHYLILCDLGLNRAVLQSFLRSNPVWSSQVKNQSAQRYLINPLWSQLCRYQSLSRGQSTAVIDSGLPATSECPQESLFPEEVYRVVPRPSVYL